MLEQPFRRRTWWLTSFATLRGRMKPCARHARAVDRRAQSASGFLMTCVSWLARQWWMRLRNSRAWLRAGGKGYRAYAAL
jgi:hypothetical protein